MEKKNCEMRDGRLYSKAADNVGVIPPTTKREPKRFKNFGVDPSVEKFEYRDKLWAEKYTMMPDAPNDYRQDTRLTDRQKRVVELYLETENRKAEKKAKHNQTPEIVADKNITMPRDILRDLQAKRGLSAKECAALLGVSQAMYSEFMSNRNRGDERMPIGTFLRFARIFGYKLMLVPFSVKQRKPWYEVKRPADKEEMLRKETDTVLVERSE